MSGRFFAVQARRLSDWLYQQTVLGRRGSSGSLPATHSTVETHDLALCSSRFRPRYKQRTRCSVSRLVIAGNLHGGADHRSIQ